MGIFTDIRFDGSDADFAGALRKPIARGASLNVVGDLSGPLSADAVVWVKALKNSSGPLRVTISGEVGEVGLALILLADHVEVGSDTVCASAAHPGLAALAMQRLGPLAARRLMATDDPLILLREIGHIHGGPPPGPALRRAWVAVNELPPFEALDFAFLLSSEMEMR